jgi:hypothetical protein
VIHGISTLVTIPASPGTIIPAAKYCSSARDRPRATLHLEMNTPIAIVHVATMNKAKGE